MEVVYLASFLKDLKKIKDKKLLIKVKAVLVQIKNVNDVDEINHVKKIKGHPFAYRIRVADYRIGFYFSEGVFKIARFVKRNDIYKLFP